MRKGTPIYRARDEWVLGRCRECGRLNYVEPHGMTAQCQCQSSRWTEHASIPWELRRDTVRGPVYVGPSRLGREV